MKNLFFGCAIAFLALAASACKDDNSGCITCTESLLGIETSTEACQNGDDVILTVTVAGISQSETVANTTVEAATAGLNNCN